MARFKTLFLLPLCVAAGACAPERYNVAPPNMGLTPANQPVVQRTDYVFDLAGGGGGLGAYELGRLDGWFQSLQLGYGDRISIDSPFIDEGARQDIAGVAATYGLLLSDGAPVTAGVIPPGAVRVVVSRNTASMPNCPNWDRRRYNATAETGSNFACAVNGNLAAMIADPGDLVLGQNGPATPEAAAVNKSVKLYRDAILTGKALKVESAGGR